MKSGLYYGWEGTGGGAADAADIFGQILEQVELGDYLGFDSALIGESHFVEGDLTGSVVDLLGALAGSTRFIRLGSAGKALALQHPANVAEDFAVIDLLSNGRAILGAGIGHSETAFGRALRASASKARPPLRLGLAAPPAAGAVVSNPLGNAIARSRSACAYLLITASPRGRLWSAMLLGDCDEL